MFAKLNLLIVFLLLASASSAFAREFADPCKLISKAEAQKILGLPVKSGEETRSNLPPGISCSYRLDLENGKPTKQYYPDVVSVLVYQSPPPTYKNLKDWFLWLSKKKPLKIADFEKLKIADSAVWKNDGGSGGVYILKDETVAFVRVLNADLIKTKSIEAAKLIGSRL